jgi:hypothetical protein
MEITSKGAVLSEQLFETTTMAKWLEVRLFLVCDRARLDQRGEGE